jgi:hypothetical protein
MNTREIVEYYKSLHPERPELKIPEWFDEYREIHCNPNVRDAENSILFTVEFYFLKDLLHISSRYDIESFKYSMTFHEMGEGKYYKSPGPERKQHASHDNMTAIMCMSKRHGLDYHKRVRIWGLYWHPRDLIFYSLLRNKWYDQWAKLFIPLLSIIMIVSCLRTFKTKPYFWERIIYFFKNGKFPELRTMISTDGKILNLLRFWSYKLPLTKRICYAILKHKFGKNFIYELMRIYFKNDEHPNRNLSWRLTTI